MKNILKKMVGFAVMALPLFGAASCTNEYLEKVNTDQTKPSTIDPSAQLTTALLQTYGDFQMMDAYRCYVTGFTQHFMGGWNVANYAGSVHADDDMMSSIWNELYNVGIKNLVDAIYRTEDRPCLNAALRIQRVYLMAVLTDTYGDVPCKEAGLGFLENISNPKYDTQEEIYHWIFDELEEAVAQLKEGTDNFAAGDVTAFKGDAKKWIKYANSLRLRYAMRISDVEPELAKAQFEVAAKDAEGGVIRSNEDNAYVIYQDKPFTLYDGARDLDFRANALGEMLYGQDSDSPTFVSRMFFDHMKDNGDPRLYRICRHYINNKRSSVKADDEWNVDVTEEVVAYENSEKGQLAEGLSYACDPGCAWWHNWVNAPANSDIPTLERLVAQYPEGGFDQANYPARMLRPFLSIKLEKAECPGVLISAAEVNFLIAEALLKGWSVEGAETVAAHYETGIRQAMELLNEYYDIVKIKDNEINDYIAAHTLAGKTDEQVKEAINTEAWVLHVMNPAEAWANLRRSDYPTLLDRTKYPKYPNDFTYDDENMNTPNRLKYPSLEAKYNKAAYTEAVDRLGGKDDWHHRVWWDTAEIHVK